MKHIVLSSFLLCFIFLQTIHAQVLCDRAGFSNGWMLNMNTTEVQTITNACAATSASYFRVDFAWSDVQYNGSNSWNWNNIDRIVNASIPNNLDIIAIVDYFPPWANIESDTTFWFDFVYQAGLRYIPQGVTVWEMWNEPNLTNFFPNPDVEKYVNKILKPGSNAIRKAALELNTPVVVLTGGLAPAATDGTNIAQFDFVKGIYDNGGKNYFDGLGQHPYCWPLDPSIPNDYNWFLKTEELYTEMQANGDGNKKIWGTEMGWPTHTAGQNFVTELEQASYLKKAYDIWNSWDWTGPLIWYAYNDAGNDPANPEHHFGLVDNNFIAKPAMDSFAIVTSLCEDNVATDLDILVESCGIHLYPNPVTDIVTIDGLTHAYTIKILDSNGVVYRDYSNSNHQISIDIQALPTGLYFIQIQREGFHQISHEKILKQ